MRDTVEMIEFGTPFIIDENGKATETQTNGYFGGICVGHDSTGQEYIECIPDGWEAVTGITGQYGYSGPVMHSSEYMTERNMSCLFDADSSNVFVFTTFYDNDHAEFCDWKDHEMCDMFGDGWLILRRV